MFFPEGQVRVHLYGRPVDMRRSYDGLYALTRNELGQDPVSGGLFVFINRRGTQIKVLYFDRTGFCVWAKRLEEGSFVSDWSRVSTREMDWTGLKLLL
jgi:transposase